jgi:hypothetical protein
MLLVCLAFEYLVLYAFGKMGEGLGYQILSTLIMFIITALPTTIWLKLTSNPSPNSPTLLKKPIYTALIWLSISILLIVSFKGICHCIFTNRYGFFAGGHYKMSTQMMRAWELETVCPEGSVCHVYATLAENASDSVFVNVHTGINYNALAVTL